MNFTIKIAPGEVRAGSATYIVDDLGLECAPREPLAVEHGSLQERIDSTLRMRQRSLQVIADTLVMTFSGKQLHLSRVEAYTNSARWQPAEGLAVPRVSATGSVFFVPQGEDVQRIDTSITPEFYYCESEKRLRISFGGSPESYYRVWSCLIVGVAADELKSLEIDDLQVV